MFKEQSQLKNICIAEELQVKSRNSLQNFFAKINSDDKVKVIVVFCVLEDTVHVMEQAHLYLDHPVVWIGADAWGKQRSAMSKVAVGAITISLKVTTK